MAGSYNLERLNKVWIKFVYLIETDKWWEYQPLMSFWRWE